MYTLGGIFSDDANSIKELETLHKNISLNEDNICNVNVPNITYKEKFYLDSKIDSLRKWLECCHNEVNKLEINSDKDREDKLKELLAEKMNFELTPDEVSNYIDYYKYFPLYYEGVI